MDLIPAMLFTRVYSVAVDDASDSLIFTLNVEVSTPLFGMTYLWFAWDSSTVQDFSRYWPWKISTVPTLSPPADENITFSGMENIKFVSDRGELAKTPGWKVIVDVVELKPLILQRTFAFAARLERGTYPIFLAKDTTFSLSAVSYTHLTLPTICSV